MKKIAANRNYKLASPVERSKGYKLIESEPYEDDHIIGYYKTKESAVMAGYQRVLMENKRQLDRLENELGWETGKPYTLEQKRKMYMPWEITKIDINAGAFEAAKWRIYGGTKNIYSQMDVIEFDYDNASARDISEIDLSKNEEYVNFYNVDTAPEEGEEFPLMEGMGRRFAAENNYKMKKIASDRKYRIISKAYYADASTNRGNQIQYLDWNENWNTLLSAALVRKSAGLDTYYVDSDRTEYQIWPETEEYEALPGIVSDKTEAHDGAIFHPSWK